MKSPLRSECHSYLKKNPLVLEFRIATISLNLSIGDIKPMRVLNESKFENGMFVIPISLMSRFALFTFCAFIQSSPKEKNARKKTLQVQILLRVFPYMETTPRSVKFAQNQERSLLLPLLLKLTEMDITAVLFIRCNSLQP